jgi:hypothetical protein
MKGAFRQLGAGRIWYQVYHRPLGAVRTCIRDGGPIEQWRTARGRRDMEAAADRTLPPLPEPPAGSPEIRLLTRAALWYQTAFFLRSLAPFQPVRPVIHDDGTLDPRTMERLRRVVPFARFVSSAEAEAALDRVLPSSRYPWLRRRRSELVLFRKILDIHAGARGWNLFCDSDMLVFRAPRLLSDWLRAPSAAIHMTDVVRSYGYEMPLLEELAGGPVPDRVNTGILGIRSDAIDWDRMEAWCRELIARAGTHYYQEQALAALLLSGQAHAALPVADYLVLPTDPEATEKRAVIHHYVAGSKRSYFRHNWRPFDGPVS